MRASATAASAIALTLSRWAGVPGSAPAWITPINARRTPKRELTTPFESMDSCHSTVIHPQIALEWWIMIAHPFTRRGLLAASPLALPLAAQAQFVASGAIDLGARIYNVRAFGAKGDGATLDTAAVQSAIDAC